MLTKSKFTLKPNNRNHDNRILESKHKQTATKKPAPSTAISKYQKTPGTNTSDI